jgi:hypothetical protein
MPPVWRFVAEPTAVPAVLLDLNDGGQWRTLDYDVSPPPLRRTIAASSMRDGGIVTSASYELRELPFTVQLGAATEDGRNQQLKDLEEELSKPANLLMYQSPDSSFPVFFRTLRSDSFRLDKNSMPGTAWRVECSVLAEPFAIGLRQSLVTNATITNNPASGTNPARIDITGVTGDAPSPAYIRLGTNITAATYFLLGQKTGNATALNPFVQAETGTFGTDTALGANDAAMSGSGSNRATVTFATDASLITRLTVTAPVTLRGTYRVYARVRQGAAADIRMRYSVPTSSDVLGPYVDLSYTGSTLDLVDLGLIDFPFAEQAPAEIGYSRQGLTYSSQSIRIMAARLTGSGNLDIDYVYFMPADERLCSFQQTESTGFLCVDGPNEAAYGLTSGSDPFGGTRTYQGNSVFPLIGGVPHLVPGVTNRWFLLRGRGSAITNTTSLWVDHWPRWREVAV